MRTRRLLVGAALLVLVALGLWQLMPGAQRGPGVTRGPSAAATPRPQRSPSAELAEPGAATRRSTRAPAAQELSAGRAAELGPRPPAIFRGRALEAVGRQPLAFFEVRLGPLGSRAERVLSDEHGYFQSSGLLRGDWAVVYDTHDADGALRPVERRFPLTLDGGVPDVLFLPSPMLFVEVLRPAGVDLADLRAKLVRLQPGRPPPFISPGLERVHPGPPDWVRFDPHAYYLAAGLQQPAELAVVVSTRDAAWMGWASLSTELLSNPPLLTIALAACAELEVRVRGPAGAPRPDADVVLRRMPLFEDETPLRTRPDGSDFDFMGLVPGAYEVSVREPRSRGEQRNVVLQHGEPLLLEIELRPLANGGSIRGVLRTRSGRDVTDSRARSIPWPRPQTRWSVELRGLDEQAHIRLFDTPQWTSDERGPCAAFQFNDVPEGRYEILPITGELDRWSRPAGELSPPRSDLELVLEDDASAGWLEVSALDAESGAELGPLRVRLELADGRTLERGVSRSLSLTRFPGEEALQWCVSAEGYREARGDRSALVEGDLREGRPSWSLRVALERE